MTDNGVDGGRLPQQGICIGGKGPDDEFRFASFTADGELVLSADVTIDPTNLATSAKQDLQTAVQGATTGAAVVTDANGTIQQYLRGLVKLFITAGSALVSVSQRQLAGVPSSFAIQTADATVFTLAAGEVGFIQNLSADAPLAVKYGASASTTSLNFILPASTAASDGTGGAYKINDWIGVVSVAKMTGTASYLAWKVAIS
jgi:hypothetical protein